MNRLSLRTRPPIINYLNVFDLFTLHIFHLFWFVTCISMTSHITEQFLLLGKLPFPFPWEQSSGLTASQRWQVHFFLLWGWLHWFKESAHLQLRSSLCSYEAYACIYSKLQTLFGLWSCLPVPSVLKFKCEQKWQRITFIKDLSPTHKKQDHLYF